MIQVRALTKTFRVHQKRPGLRGSVSALWRREWIEKAAVKGASFDVGPGEIVGLVGANGAGKTTLVKMLAGIIHPTSGSARILGHEPWRRHSEFRRQIALIMGQKAQLWWDLPAADGFLLLREIYRVPEREHRETLEFLVEALGVRSELRVQVRKLSLGERMKMELIAALLHSPKVVFLDEPTIGLDLTAQRAIRDFLLKYRSERAPAMLLTSHYMEDIERLCRRIIIIREGEFVYDGPLARIASEHAAVKIVSVRLREGEPAGDLAGLGERLPAEAGTLRLKIARDRVPEVAARLLRELPVADLDIEDEDIGTLIEAIQRKGLAGGARG